MCLHFIISKDMVSLYNTKEFLESIEIIAKKPRDYLERLSRESRDSLETSTTSLETLSRLSRESLETISRDSRDYHMSKLTTRIK
jgi:hypothetical protein